MNKEILEQRFIQLRILDKELISQKQTALNLGLSVRQAQRILKRLRENNWNLNCLVKPRGGWNKRKGLRAKVILLHQQKPQRSNPAIQDQLKEQGVSVSLSTIRRIRIEADLYKDKPIKKRFFKKFESKRFGDLVQMDTMDGGWLNGEKIKLILVLDDYSRAILGFRWAKHDTVWQNMLVLRQMIEKYGKPGVIYTDNDNKFRFVRTQSLYFNYRKEEYETRIRGALKELDIALICHPPYQAFCKGKVERLFRFVQSRFLPEMKAKNLEQLNQGFKKWIAWYNENHINRMTESKPKERFQPSGFQPLSGKEDLDYIFSLRETRKIDKYNSFSFNGKKYFLESKEPLWGCKATLALNPSHRIKVYYDDKFIQEFKLN